jgi:glycosyltransferase involved in cell wall biosynthesis
VNQFRILMYSSYFPPEYSGAALQAIALSRHLRELGHQIEFVTQRWPGLARDDEVDGFRVTRLEPGRGSKHRELRLWWNLYRFLQSRRGEFDFLHSHGAYYKDAVVGPLARHFGMRSIVKASLADNDLRDLGRSVTGRIHRAMLRRVDACVAISRDLEAEFACGGIPAEQVRYMPNGVDVERFRPADAQERRQIRERLGLPRDRKLVLYVGVFDERKNIGWLIREWLAAGGFGLGAMLLAIGPQSRDDPDGRFKQGLLAEAQRQPELLRIGDKVDDVADYYRAADAFVMPSLCEGMPNAVLEAMSCGLPCVAANVSGTRELVDSGVTGFLFDSGVVETLREGLVKALSDEGASLGAAARARVEQDFALGQLAGRYEELYAQLLR